MVNIKWDDKYLANAPPRNIGEYVSKIVEPIADGSIFQLRKINGINSGGLKCAKCTQEFTYDCLAYIKVWVGPRWVLHEACGNLLRGLATVTKDPRKVSKGYSYRCIECTLVRCSEPDTICEECQENWKNA